MKRFLPLFCGAMMLLPLASCLDDDDKDRYADWKKENEEYALKAEIERNADGTPVYTKVVPDWASGIYVLMKWHNDRSLTADKLVPLDNSTCEVKYLGELIDDTQFDSSFAQVDSVYKTQPYKNIPGFWAALTSMHVGDSVTVVIPWQAAYGSSGSGSKIKPYSTLIFHLKLKGISSYETPQ